MDLEIQKLIDDFVESLNENEERLLDFNLKTVEIYQNSQNQMESLTNIINNDFELNKINESEYLKLLSEGKNKILEDTKRSMENLIKSLD